MNLSFFRFLAWMQLAISGLIAGGVIWAYLAYHPSFGQLLKSSSETIVATANVVAQIADAVQANEVVVTDAQKLLLASRQLVDELQNSVQNQAALAPTYAEGVRSMSGLLARTGTAFSALGDGMMFSVPLRVEMDGIRPIVVFGRPLQGQAQAFKDISVDLNRTGNSLLTLSTSLTNDSKGVSTAVIATSNQTRQLIDSIEKSLADLHKQTLPNAVVDLKSAASNLSSISSGIAVASHITEALVGLGLLLSAWCFVHSLGQLHILSTRRIS